MRASLFALATFFVACGARADGVPLDHGRYVGSVAVFELTKAQKKTIDHFRTCHLDNFKTMNVYTPYVLTLTPNQSQTLKAKKGFAPHLFEVYETYRGYNDAGPHWNIALRFSEREIEVPLDLLLSDSKAKQAHDEQGWKSFNPCFPALGKL